MKSIQLKNLNLSPEDSRDLAEYLAQKRRIIDYGNMSKDKLFNALKVSENKNKTRIDGIRKEIISAHNICNLRYKNQKKFQ